MEKDKKSYHGYNIGDIVYVKPNDSDVLKGKVIGFQTINIECLSKRKYKIKIMELIITAILFLIIGIIYHILKGDPLSIQ